MIAGVGGTDGLAGRLIALLAEDRLEADAGIWKIAFPVALDTNPMLGAAPRSLVFSRRGNIVFRVARDNAGFASGAAVKVDHQSPLMACCSALLTRSRPTPPLGTTRVETVPLGTAEYPRMKSWASH